MKQYILALSALLILFSSNVSADQNSDKVIRKALQERTKAVCETVLPAWFFSQDKNATLALRRSIVDCYVGYARLSTLGDNTSKYFDNTALSELPAVLLSRKYGLDLDIYRPLAGKTLTIRRTVE